MSNHDFAQGKCAQCYDSIVGAFNMNPALISGIIVLALAARVGYVNIYLSGQEELRHVREEQHRLEEFQNLRLQVASALDQAERLRTKFGQKAEPDGLMQEVDRLAQKVGIELGRIGPEQTREASGFLYLAISLEVTCTYHELGRFLSEIESSDTFFIRVNELDVSRIGDAQGSAAAKLVLSTLYVPPLLEPQS